MSFAEQPRPLRAVPGGSPSGGGRSDPAALEALLARVATGDRQAYAAVYDRVAASVYGLILRVLRDPAQSEEVTQEVLLEVWRTAARFDAARGSANAWVMTMAHRRAVDRVRSEQASRNRDERVATRGDAPAFDQVAEEVERRADHQQVRQALDQLTDLQREAIQLAYFGGHTYREVAELLDAPLGTVKTRLRDGLTRLRDTLGVGP